MTFTLRAGSRRDGTRGGEIGGGTSFVILGSAHGPNAAFHASSGRVAVVSRGKGGRCRGGPGARITHSVVSRLTLLF